MLTFRIWMVRVLFFLIGGCRSRLAVSVRCSCPLAISASSRHNPSSRPGRPSFPVGNGIPRSFGQGGHGKTPAEESTMPGQGISLGLLAAALIAVSLSLNVPGAQSKSETQGKGRFEQFTRKFEKTSDQARIL